MQKVIVGLSGGVDSTVAAYLLKKQGYQVIGLFMKNWHDESVTLSADCPWWADSNDALMVAEQIGIPFQTVDLSEDYRKRIVNYMFSEYARGKTPNPDVLCNREIKFDVFLKFALSLGADYVATGHYCQKKTSEIGGKKTYHLIAGEDQDKDQSYFLCQITPAQLSKALFPLGRFNKSQVREIAKQQGFVTADKKDSQGLCFVGKVKLPDFLKQQLRPKQGTIVEIPASAPLYEAIKPLQNNIPEQPGLDFLRKLAGTYHYKPTDGKPVGTHQGAHYFTIGQRKGLNVGGSPEPLFVLATDINTNTVYVGQGKNHPGLYRSALFLPAEKVQWLQENRKPEVGTHTNFCVRIRYRQPLQAAKLFATAEGFYLLFKNPQRSIAAGQFAAWYEQNELIGSGVIG